MNSDFLDSRAISQASIFRLYIALPSKPFYGVNIFVVNEDR